MPINQTIWQISGKVEQIKESKLDNENELESVLQSNIEILNENWLVIGRQVQTRFNKYIDLLAIDANGSIIILELKKDKTYRDVVGQAIDYASWVKTLSSDDIADIFETFDSKYLKSKQSLDQAFFNKFRIKLDEELLNSSHQMIIVASELDSNSERIVKYLSEYSIPVNVVFFKIFTINGVKCINRAWFIDPYETADIATTRDTKEPWNGEYYISFGEGENRNWEDAMKYGFISGGGGAWYSRTLNQLTPGNRVWVNIPGSGYVGVGIVTDTVRKADQLMFNMDGKELPIYELPVKANYHKHNNDDEDKAEYLVKVDWLKTVKRDDAVSEVGFFGNQNTVAKPTTGKWNHTVDRLKSVWGIK